MKRSFETNKGPKQDCRQILCSRAIEFLPHVPKKIFTLPGEQALCVKTFREKFPKANIVGVEVKKKTCEIIQNNGIDCINCSVKTFVKSTSLKGPHFDIAFLDFFSYLNKSVMDDIRLFLSNENLMHPGKRSIVGVTLSKPIRGESDAVNDIMREHIYQGHRREVGNTLKDVGSCLKNFISSLDKRPKEIMLVDSLEYSAVEGSTRMYFFCFVVTAKG